MTVLEAVKLNLESTIQGLSCVVRDKTDVETGEAIKLLCITKAPESMGLEILSGAVDEILESKLGDIYAECPRFTTKYEI